MKENKDQVPRTKIVINKNVLLALIWLIVFLSLPSGVYMGMTEIVDDISFVVLIILFLVFICAIIGYYSRRINIGGAPSIKSGGIFK